MWQGQKGEGPGTGREKKKKGTVTEVALLMPKKKTGGTDAWAHLKVDSL